MASPSAQTLPTVGAYSFSPKQEKLLLFVLAAIQFTHVLDFVIMMPLGPQLIRVFSITPQQFGLLVSAYTVSAGISGFAGSFFIDRFDRRAALLWLYIGFTVGTLACALSPDYAFLLAARIFAGLFGGVLGALIFAIIGDAIPEARRGMATGKVMASFSVASVIGVPFGLYLATLISWHAPFVLLAGASALVLPVAFKALPSMIKHLAGKRAAGNPFANLQTIFTNSNMRWALSLMMMLNVAGFMVIPFLSQYMVQNVGLREDQLPYIYLFGGALSYFTSPYIGKLADRYGKPRVFVWMAVSSLLPVLLITNLSVTPLWIVLVITTFFFVVNGGRFVPAVALVTSSALPRVRGSFMSINSSLQSLAAGFASYLAGLIVTEASDKSLLHFSWTGLVSAVATLLCILICLRVKTVDQPSPVKAPDSTASTAEEAVPAAV
ncbi:MAG: MFS transporter [Ferruginibacter sp.]|nr:MFS transporter [Cytophagales bacterium]